MLKPQDCVLLLKIVAHRGKNWPQRALAAELCISLFEVNKAISRLVNAGLLRKVNIDGIKLLPNLMATKEFLIYGLKYCFPAKLGELTPGIATSIASPILKDSFLLEDEPLPVWPYGKGKIRGVALTPLYKNVPQSLDEHPDDDFYDLLALVDAIRQGRARERAVAIKMLKEKLGVADG